MLPLIVSGLLKSEPLLLPGRNILNSSMMLGNIGAMGYFLYDETPTVGMSMLGATTALSSIMGVTLTAAIGGASHAPCLSHVSFLALANENNISQQEGAKEAKPKYTRRDITLKYSTHI